MKKIMALLLLIFSFTLLSCNNDKEHNPTIEPTETPTVEPTIDSTEIPTADPFLEYNKVPSVFDNINNTYGMIMDLYIDYFLSTNKNIYMYEVEYKTNTDEYIAAYLKKSTALEIYDYYDKNFTADVARPSSLDNVNGDMVYCCDRNELTWLSFNDINKIPVNIGDYICVGVFVERERTVLKEVLNDKDINLSDIDYDPISFKDTKEEYLTLSRNVVDEKILKPSYSEVLESSDITSLLDSHDVTKFVIEEDLIKVKLGWSITEDGSLNSNSLPSNEEIINFYNDIKPYYISKDSSSLNTTIYNYEGLMNVIKEYYFSE